MTATRRAVLLGRVSRSERTQDPEGQLIALRSTAARFGWIVVEEVSLKVSAWDAESAKLVRARALAPIERGDADLLAVWSWDRFSREGVEGAFRDLRHLERHLGASFYSLNEPFLSTATADPQQRELMLSIIAWAAKWESERRSARLKAKAVSKRHRAESLGQRAVWGKGKLASASDVERAHALKTAGKSVRAIAAELGVSKSQVQRLLVGGDAGASRA